MIGTIIMGLGVVAGLFATFANWKEIVKWFKDFITALKDLFVTTLKGIAHAAAAFIQVVKEGVAALMHKLYYKEEGQWVEEVRRRVVPENELPAWAKKKLNIQEETDITENLQEELKMTL